MPSEKFDSSDGGLTEREKERSVDKDRDKGVSKSKNGQSKVKDLSHVPCKFFKLGQCTAGASCPFSHHVLEPGQQKDVCQWFVKGNCKFGHKCALAHILPGQPMSMDRKNKKAAQQQAAAATGAAGGGGGGTTRSDRRRPASSSVTKEEGIRAGLGRGVGRGAAPISISKATISPSAPAPPLRDTDFPFGLPDDFTHPVQAQAKQTDAVESVTAQKNDIDSQAPSSSDPPAQITATSPPRVESQRPSPLPLSTPSARVYARQNGSGDFGFGPIGSPPRSSPGHTPKSQAAHQGQRINGFSPSTSPPGAGVGAPIPSTSPFSSAVPKSIFMSYSLDRDSSASTQLKATRTSTPLGGGVAASLGAGRGWEIGYSGMGIGGLVDEDEDLEEFLPSSLNELLTDEEKKRRWSRTGGQRPSLEPHHHRYSRSVPAASLMDNVKNIWSENGQESHGSGAPSPSLMGSSNISTGFVPQRTPLTASRAVSDTNPPHSNNIHLGPSSPPGAGYASPPLTSFYNVSRPPSHPLPASSTTSNFNVQQPRPIPGAAGDEAYNRNPLSPSTRALQEHAPGKSLPQGLAAGLSRIHVKPPAALGTSTSPHHVPGMQGGSPSPRLGGVNMGRGYSTSGDFTSTLAPLGPTGGAAGLGRDPFDRLPSFGSRSSGIGSSVQATGGLSPSPSPMGAGLRRQQWGSQQVSSPLSGAVIAHDEDDGLFAMDEDSK